jgi:peptidylprolyl isomerase
VTRSSLRLLAIGLVVGLLAGCSASSRTSANSPSISSSGSASSGASVISGPGTLSYDGVTVKGDVGREPAFLIGDETQQTSSIQVRDVVVGTGAAATATGKVTVDYAARGARSKRTFDSSWLRGKPFSFVPSKIAFKAFSSGVPGMRVGGRRLVIVPGPLAFGGSPPSGSGLAANETVVFVIDLVSA